MRFGPRQLEESIEEYNSTLAQKGILIRFVSGGRNGYQAADEYSVDESGKRIGSGVNRNVACGSSREVSQACQLRMYQLLSQR